MIISRSQKLEQGCAGWMQLLVTHTSQPGVDGTFHLDS